MSITSKGNLFDHTNDKEKCMEESVVLLRLRYDNQQLLKLVLHFNILILDWDYRGFCFEDITNDNLCNDSL